MPLTLPTSPNTYSRAAEQERSRKLEAADRENWKRNQNIQIAGGATLSYQASDGSNWSFGVNGDGSVYMKNVATGVVVPIGGGTGVPPEFETNGVANPIQSMLNLIAGPNVTLTADASGGVTIDASGGGGAGAVASVFGRTGAVTAYSGDYTAAQVTNAVSTVVSYSNPAWITSLSWSKITGAPATGVLSIFGRTGAVVAEAGDYTASMVTNAVDSSQSYADPAWLTSLDWSKITGVPAGFGQTPWLSAIDGGGYSLTNVDLISVGGLTGQEGVPLQVGSWRGTCVQMYPGSGETNLEIYFQGNVRWNVGVGTDSASYGAALFYFMQDGGGIALCLDQNNRVGIGTTSPQYALDTVGDCNVTGVYRINGVPISAGVSSVFGRAGAVVAVAGDYVASQVTNAVDSTQAYANPAWITSLAWSKITGAPATGVSSVFGRTGAVVAASGDYTAAEVTNAVDQTGAYANPAWITSLAYSKITGAPGAYVLPPATASVLGGVKIGSGITVQADGTISTTAGGGTVTSVGLAMPAEFSVTGSPVTGSGTLTVAKATQSANLVYAGPASGSAVAPAFRSLAAADLPAATTSAVGAIQLARDLGGTDTAPKVIGIQGVNVSATAPTNGQVLQYVSASSNWAAVTPSSGGSVTSVALTMPAEFAVAGSPITTSGTLAVTKATQAANLVFAGPASGSAAAPAFRALAAADLPSGTGTVTSVALTMPSDFTVGGSPITTSGTLAVTRATQAKNLVLAGPASGSNAVPAYRALVAADLPSGLGTVTSVALTMPAEFAVGGSPITSSGTLAVTKATQSANLVYAGPASGSAAAPTFRALAAADFSSSVITGFQTPWLQNINGAGYSLTNVSQIGIGTSSPQFRLDITGGALGATQGNVVNLLNLYNTNSNSNYFQIWQFRNAGGSDWTTATTRIMNFTDVNAQAYIDFNPPGGTWGMAFGLGSGEKIRISNNNCVGIGTASPNKTLSVNGDIAIPAGSRLYLQSDTDPNHYIYDNGSAVMIFGEWNGNFNFYDTNAGVIVANMDGHNFGLNNGCYYSHGGGAGLYVDDRNSTSYSWGFYAASGSARISSSQYGGDQYYFSPGALAFGNIGGPNSCDIQSYMNGSWALAVFNVNTYWNGSGFTLRNSGYPGIFTGPSVLNNGTGDAGYGVSYVPIGGGSPRQLLSAQMYQGYCYTTLSAGSGGNIDAQVVQGGQWYTYAPNNTQLYFRMRGSDGVFRQAVLNLS